MNRKLIISLIVLMSISLLGIIAVQVLWIRNAIKIEEKTFNSNINKVLHSVVNKLEEKETILIMSDELHKVSHLKYGDIEIDKVTRFIKGNKDKKKQHVRTTNQWVDKGKNHNINSDTQIIISGDHVSARSYQFVNPKTIQDSAIKIDIKINNIDTIIRRIKKEKQLEKVFSKMMFSFKTKDDDIKDRVDLEKLPAYIKADLNNFGINTDFNFGIVNTQEAKVIFTPDSAFNPQLLSSKYQVKLFPHDIIEKSTKLAVSFPRHFSLIYQSIFPLLILSAIFTLFIIVTFVNAVIFILKQKKINDIKSDFINNITHEFKTPIATIGLAADSINNHKVIGKPDKIRYFTNIIKDENFRMNKQVENILQLSLFGKHELEIIPQACHVNELIQKAADHIQLQVEEKQGKISSQLNALYDTAQIDEVHFLNVLFNLFDNAIKYTDGPPNITIRTKNKEDKIVVRITDSGIGMNSKTLKRAFQKFYRAQTGNIHKIKGFGLGLSYVKLIIDRHQGKIDIESKPGKGTSVEISLPLSRF